VIEALSKGSDTAGVSVPYLKTGTDPVSKRCFLVLYTRMREVGMNTQLFSENVKERSHSMDLDVHARIILKRRNRTRGY
jgi:hypothetical protein